MGYFSQSFFFFFVVWHSHSHSQFHSSPGGFCHLTVWVLQGLCALQIAVLRIAFSVLIISAPCISDVALFIVSLACHLFLKEQIVKMGSGF